MRGFLRLLVLTTLAFFLSIPVAEARKGGSFGSRSGFSGSSSRSSGSSSSFGGSSRSSSYGGGTNVAVFGGGGYYGGWGGGGHCGDPSTIVVILIVLFGIAAFVGYRFLKARKQLLAGGTPGRLASGSDGACSVARLSVAFFATERALQIGMDGLAGSGRAGTPEGDAWLVREVALLMTRSRDATCRFFFEQNAGLSPGAARSRLEEIGIDLRSRFDTEAVRADEGGVRRAATPIGESDEVSEFIVVSLAVALRPPILQKTKITDSVALMDLIREIASLGPEHLLGLEAAWDPVSADEALTSAEVDRNYPELLPL